MTLNEVRYHLMVLFWVMMSRAEAFTDAKMSLGFVVRTATWMIIAHQHPWDCWNCHFIHKPHYLSYNSWIPSQCTTCATRLWINGSKYRKTHWFPKLCTEVQYWVELSCWLWKH